MFIKNVFYTFSTELLTVASNFLVGVVLARSLSPFERGVMALMMTLPWTAVSLVSLGLPQANIYMIGRKRSDSRSVLGNTLALALILGLMSVIVLSLLKSWLFQTVLQDVPPRLWLALIVLTPAILVDVMSVSFLCARQRFDLFNLRRAVLPVLLLVGLVVGLPIAGGDLTTAVWIYFGVVVLTMLFSLFLASRESRLAVRFDLDLTKESLRFGSKSYLHDLVGNLNYRVDAYIIASLLSARQVAFYGVATSVAEVAWYIPNSVGTVLFPRLTNAPLQKIHQITARVCRNTLILTGLVVLGLLALGWLLVPLVYGSPYQASVPPLLVLLPGVTTMVIYKVLTRDFNSRNQQQIPILAAGIALTLNVSLDFLLIGRLGVTGAAIASTTGYTAAGVVLLVFFLRRSKLPWQDALLPRFDELVGHLRWARSGLPAPLRRNKTRADLQQDASS